MTILRKACVYRLFTNETGRYDTNPGHRYFCLSCQQLTANQYEFTAHNVDCSRSLSVCQLLESNNNAYLICILLLCPLINMFCMHCWVCAAGHWKLDPKRSREKWYLGAKKIEFCEDLYPKDRFCVGGWEKTPQKDRARSCSVPFSFPVSELFATRSSGRPIRFLRIDRGKIAHVTDSA